MCTHTHTHTLPPQTHTSSPHPLTEGKSLTHHFCVDNLKPAEDPRELVSSGVHSTLCVQGLGNTHTHTVMATPQNKRLVRYVQGQLHVYSEQIPYLLNVCAKNNWQRSKSRVLQTPWWPYTGCTCVLHGTVATFLNVGWVGGYIMMYLVLITLVLLSPMERSLEHEPTNRVGVVEPDQQEYQESCKIELLR